MMSAFFRLVNKQDINNVKAKTFSVDISSVILIIPTMAADEKKIKSDKPCRIYAYLRIYEHRAHRTWVKSNKLSFLLLFVDISIFFVAFKCRM